MLIFNCRGLIRRFPLFCHSWPRISSTLSSLSWQKEERQTKIIQSMLDCSIIQAQHIVRAQHKLNTKGYHWLEKAVRTLLDTGLTKDEICHNSWLFDYKMSDIIEGFKLLTKNNIQGGLFLLKLQPKLLPDLINQCQTHNIHFPEQFQLLAKVLRSSEKEIRNLILKHPPLICMESMYVEYIVELLLSHGQTLEMIHNNLSQLSLADQIMHSRLNQLRAATINPIQPWMLLCVNTSFKNVLLGSPQEKDILGLHKDRISYLTELLHCTNEDVNYILNKFPQLTSVRLAKIRDILSFLYANGFTPVQVQLGIYVLMRSLISIKKRYYELSTLNHKFKNLSVFYFSTSDYNKLIYKLRNAKI